MRSELRHGDNGTLSRIGTLERSRLSHWANGNDSGFELS